MLAELRWLTPQECGRSPRSSERALALELADVMIYLCRLADVTGSISWMPRGAKMLDQRRTLPRSG